ncbi:MAG: lipoprotein LpqV [Mycobacterium sp.]
MVVSGLSGLSAVTGCSAGAHNGGKTTPSSAQSPATPNGRSSPTPDAIGRSPAGVTTRVDVPADSTEEEYYQACHAAKVWMGTQPRTGQSLFESYLAMVQATPAGTPGTWNARWADLSLARRAAVITAARAAADDDECG